MKMIIKHTSQRLQTSIGEADFQHTKHMRFFLRNAKHKLIVSAVREAGDQVYYLLTRNVFNATHGDLEDIKKLQEKIHRLEGEESTELCAMSNRHYMILWQAEMREDMPKTIMDIINVVRHCPYDPEDIAAELCVKFHDDLNKFVYHSSEAEDPDEFPGCPPGCMC
jgi:hypothetical protein